MPENQSYLIDDGDLLHIIHWPRPATFGDVCYAYLDNCNRNYGTNILVRSIIDEYEPSTKDDVRRDVGKLAAIVDVTPFKVVTIAQARKFLSNVDNNKVSFETPKHI